MACICGETHTNARTRSDLDPDTGITHHFTCYGDGRTQSWDDRPPLTKAQRAQPEPDWEALGWRAVTPTDTATIPDTLVVAGSDDQTETASPVPSSSGIDPALLKAILAQQ